MDSSLDFPDPTIAILFFVPTEPTDMKNFCNYTLTSRRSLLDLLLPKKTYLWKKIETAHGKFNAYINRLHTPHGDSYHISFVDNHNKAHVAVLIESIDGWSFVNGETLPQSIIELHRQFEMLIARYSLRHHSQPLAKAV